MTTHERASLLQKISEVYHKFLPYHNEITKLRRKIYRSVPRIVRSKKISDIPKISIMKSILSMMVIMSVATMLIGDSLMPDDTVRAFLTLRAIVTTACVALLIYIYKRRNRICNEGNQRIQVLSAEIRELIEEWPECPIIWPNYTHPLWVDKIYQYIENGRADTVQQAVNLIETDRQHKESMAAHERAINEQKRLRSEGFWDDIITIGIIAVFMSGD